MEEEDSRITACILCGKYCDESTDAISSIEKWENIKKKSQLWIGLDKFGNIHSRVDWEQGPAGYCVHDSCRMTLCNSKKLEQAKKRQKKHDLEIYHSHQSSSGSEPSSHVEAPAAKRLRSSLGPIHDKTKCVWCSKPASTKHPESKLYLISYNHTWAAFKRHTMTLEDQVMRDRINCLIDSAADDPYALEIRYHHKCWLKYVSRPQKMSEDDKLPQMQGVTLREAQTIFFDHIRSVIFKEHELRSLQSLLRDYSSIIPRYGFLTSGIRSSYIKDILTREFKEKIGFHPRSQQNESELVYDTSDGGSYVEAALSSVGVSIEQLVCNIAKRLRDDINSIKPVSWPPSVEELEEEEELSPLLLQLLSALHGKKGIDHSPITLSLASLISQYVSKRPTTTAINASITLHGMTRSKELVNSFYKLGMGISYSNVLLLYDTWTMNDLKRCSVCPDKIAENIPSISIIDNDDFRNDTLTGGGTAHRTNWMFLQRINLQSNKKIQKNGPLIEDTKTMSLVLSQKASDMQTVTPYKTIRRGEPPIRPEPATLKSNTKSQRKRSIIHILARADSNGDRTDAAEQMIPSYSGFHASLTSKQSKSKAYYHMSYNQPPNKSVENDIMENLSIIITTKRMPFAFLVGDLPVYVLITLLKAENPSKFGGIVPFLGPFHTQCAMMSTIYKRYKGSELEELLVAGGVVAEGSVDHALKGKHYKRGLRCLKLMYEALMSQLVKERIVPNLANETMTNLTILRNNDLTQESRAAAHEALENDTHLAHLIDGLLNHVEGSDMAAFWEDFLSMTDALMQNVHAVHVCNWDEFVSSLRAIMPWMIAYDNNWYGRWLPDFWAMLTSLTDEQIAFLRTDFVQSITGNPYSNIPWDMWIECTMNKGSKMKSGWLSLLQNEKQLLVHSRNVNNVAQIRAAHNARANQKKSSRKHTECGPKRMKEDEQCVQDLITCMHEFDAYPFDPATPTLRTLQSAIPASGELAADFRSAQAAGKKLTNFLKDRVFSKNTSIHTRVPLSKRLTFAKEHCTKPVKENLKVRMAEMEQNALKAVVSLVEKNQLLNLSELLQHRVVEECVSLFNCNGTFRKVQKSKLIQKLSLQQIDLQESYVALVDMGMIWRMATPSAEDRQKQDNTTYKWSDYALKVSSIILARHKNAHCIICVNDPYDASYSTKDDERDLRLQGKTNIPNIYMKLNDQFPSAREFKIFLCSASNKTRLQKLLCNYLTDLSRNIDLEIIYSVGSKCTNLSTQKQMEHFCFDQSEADTIIFSIYSALRKSEYNGPVVIDVADTDAYVSAAVLSRQLPGMLCIMRKQQTILCRGLVSEEMAKCIVQLHCFTGCDANSGFYGKGKPSVYDRVAKSPLAQHQLARCGSRLDLEDEVLEQLIRFTRQVIYGDKTSNTMAEARAAKWKLMKTKSFLRLPPDEDSLRQHCFRANYLAYLTLHPALRSHPSPIGHGWELIEGHCRPVRHTHSALPNHLSAPGLSEESESETDFDCEENVTDDYTQMTREQYSSESEYYDTDSSETECSDLDQQD